MGETILSATEANYEIACIVCGQKPTVDIITPGEPAYHTELCEVCEAAYLDPDEW